MDYISAHCLAQKCAIKDYKEEWDAFRYMVDGKMFAMVGAEKAGRPIISLKLDPQNGELLRASFPEKIIPGYYMNKIHWNSFYLDIPQDEKLIKQCIEESYSLILKSLSQKRQKEILGQE